MGVRLTPAYALQQPKQEEKETATTTSPSTRMLLCLECNKGLEKPPVAAAAAPPTTHQQEEEDKEERVGIKEGGAGGVMTLLMSVMTAACLLVLPALVLLLTYPASLLLGSKGGQAAAGVAVWAAVWALVDRNLTHRLWFLPSSHGAISVLYAGFTSLSSVTALLLLARGQGRWWLQRQQQLSFCGFYALALTLSLLSKGNGRKGKGGGSAGAHVPPSRMWQGTMLALHSALLLLLLSSHPNSTMDEPRDGQV